MSSKTKRDRMAEMHRGQDTGDAIIDAMFSFKAGWDAGSLNENHELSAGMIKVMADRDRWRSLAEFMAKRLEKHTCEPLAPCDWCNAIERFEARKEESR